MKVLKLVVAVALTIGLLKVASENSRGRPEFVDHSENGYAFEYTTVPKGLEFTEVTIPISITGDMSDGLTPVIRRTAKGQDKTTILSQYSSTPLVPDETKPGVYSTVITTGEKGNRFYYYFELIDSTGTAVATFTEEEGEPFLFKYIGEVPRPFLLAHIALIFASVFFISIASVNAIALVRGGTDVKPMARYFLMAAICAFLGGYPFGIPMNWYAFGGSWEGVPFGTDATDNKTQLLFVYLLFMVLATWRSVTNGRMGKDIFTSKVLGWLGVIAFFDMLAIYLIPHSIQFSAALTYSVCYAYIGFFTLLYIVGLTTSKKSIGEVSLKQG